MIYTLTEEFSVQVKVRVHRSLRRNMNSGITTEFQFSFDLEEYRIVIFSPVQSSRATGGNRNSGKNFLVTCYIILRS